MPGCELNWASQSELLASSIHFSYFFRRKEVAKQAAIILMKIFHFHSLVTCHSMGGGRRWRKCWSDVRTGRVGSLTQTDIDTNCGQYYRWRLTGSDKLLLSYPGQAQSAVYIWSLSLSTFLSVCCSLSSCAVTQEQLDNVEHAHCALYHIIRWTINIWCLH